MTVSRGIRMADQQFNRAWEIFLEVTTPKKKSSDDIAKVSKHRKRPLRSSVQLNEVLTVLIELGMGTWSKLPAEMRRGLFKKRKYDQQEKFQRQLEGRVATLGERFKLDDRVALAIPSTVKTNLRLEKQRTGISISKQVRRRAGLEGEALRV
jgi:hypothetical protein